VSTEITHRQKIGHVPLVAHSLVVEAVRSARLDDSLSHIDARKLLGIRLTDHSNSSENHPIDLNRGEVEKLRDLLTQALAETEGDPERWSDLTGALAA